MRVGAIEATLTRLAALGTLSRGAGEELSGALVGVNG